VIIIYIYILSASSRKYISTEVNLHEEEHIR